MDDRAYNFNKTLLYDFSNPTREQTIEIFKNASEKIENYRKNNIEIPREDKMTLFKSMMTVFNNYYIVLSAIEADNLAEIVDRAYKIKDKDGNDSVVLFTSLDAVDKVCREREEDQINQVNMNGVKLVVSNLSLKVLKFKDVYEYLKYLEEHGNTVTASLMTKNFNFNYS